MVRTLLIAISCMFFLGGTTYAQQTMEIPLDAKQFDQQNQKIKDVTIGFCDDPSSKSIDYIISLGKTHELCLQLQNNSDSDVTVQLGFVDGTVTNDERAHRACGLDSDIVAFGQYVTGYQSIISVPSKTSITTSAYIFYPQTSDVKPGSMIQGCVVYSLLANNGTVTQDEGFGIVVRRAKFINLYIQKAPTYSRYFVILMICLLCFLLIWYKRTNKGM